MTLPAAQPAPSSVRALRARSLVARGRAFVRSASFIYLAAGLLGRVGAIVLIPLYTKRLSPTAYGTYGLAMSLLSILSLTFNCGLNAGLTRAFFSTPDLKAARPLVGSIAKGMMLVAGTNAALAAAAVTLCLPHGLLQLSQRELLLVIAASYASIPSTIPDAFLRSSQKPMLAAAIGLGQFFFGTGLGIFFVAGLGRGLDGALEATLTTNAIFGVVGATFTFVYLGGRDVVRATRDALRFSLPFVPHYIATWVQDAGDRWILSAYGNPRDLGPYYLATQLLSPIPMVTTSLNSAESPRVGEMYREGGIAAVAAAMPSQYRRFVGAAVAVAAMIALGSPLLPLVIGGRFLGVLAILPFLGLAGVIDAAYYPSSNLVFYSGRSQLIPVITVISAVVGLTLCMVLLKAFGLPGLLAARVATAVVRTTTLATVGRVLARPPAHAA